MNFGKALRRTPVMAVATGILAASVAFATPASAGVATQGTGGGSPIVAKSDDGMMKSKVSGTASDGRKVSGTFTPDSFSSTGDTVSVTGTLDLVLRGNGERPERVSVPQTLEVVGASGPGFAAAGGPGMPGSPVGACDILHLDLGPLNLDLLGLQIHLDQIVLDIVAQSGAGNLLGNLLCAVAGLLDGGTPLSQLLGQLTQILALLGL